MGGKGDVPEPPGISENLKETLAGFEEALIPADMWVQTPVYKTNPFTGEQYIARYERKPTGLTAGQSRAGRLAEVASREQLRIQKELGPAFQELQRELTERSIRLDPVASRLRTLAVRSIEGQTRVRTKLEQATTLGLDELVRGELPGDVQRSLLEDVRGAQAARGVVASPGAAIEEAARLAGGREAFRASRLGQAGAFLTQSQNLAAPGIGFANVPGVPQLSPPQQFLPTPGAVFSGGIQLSDLSQRAALANAQLDFQRMQAYGQLAGTALGFGALGFGSGGGFAQAGAALLGSEFRG